MDRREFISTAASAGAGIALGGRVPFLAETAISPPTPNRDPKYWLWTDIDKKAQTAALKEKYRRMRSSGMNGVFIGGGVDDREFEIIRESGLEVHAWMWTTNRGDQWIRDNHPDWYMVSRSGKSCFDKPPYVDYYRWISPVIPGVQRYLEDKVGELARHPAVSGVHLDYVRYPDVILPRALWAKYGLDQTEELPDYDFCYSPHTREAFKRVSGRDPMEITDPSHDQEWLHYRYDTITALVKKLAKVAHSQQKKITAAVFPTPRLARKICRQDWDKWPLDAACPMTYHSFYNEPISWVGDCVLENIQTATFPIYAGLYMPDLGSTEDFRTVLELCHRKGAAGVSLFGGISDAHWRVFEETVQRTQNKRSGSYLGNPR